MIDTLVPAMTEACGADYVITDPAELRTYECDGLTSHRSVPGLVVLPETAEQVAGVVRACAAAGVPFVARGSGTGLSGGALAPVDGVLIVMSRMRKILEIDARSRRAVVEPGVTNLAVSKAAEPFGYFYAPDPSSQVICSIGGNVAENSGGAHCLKHGFTVNHVTGLEVVTPDGEIVWLGDGTGAAPGYDLLGAFTGSEGTMGIVTKIIVRLTRIPAAVTTLLAGFGTTGEGGAAVSAIIAAGIVPAAIEMMDALSIEAAEAAVHCNYPAGAGAVLVVELDGPAADVEAETAAVRETLREGRGYRDPGRGRPGRARRHLGRPQVRVRRRRPDQHRLHRAGRRGAAHRAAGRAGPDRGAVRRDRDPGGERVPRRRREPAPAGAARRSTDPEAAEELSGAILDLCIEHGGSITGEHGVGVDKSRYMPRMFSPEDLDTMQMVRCAFDPRGLCNPGKIYPTPRLCGERPGIKREPHPLVASGQADLL